MVNDFFQCKSSSEIDLSAITEAVSMLGYDYISSNENPERSSHVDKCFYEYESKLETDDISQFLTEYSNKIKGMFLTNANTDLIFSLSARLIEMFAQLCQNLLKVSSSTKNGMIQFALDFVLNKLSEDRSTYKRQQKLIKNELFVAPDEKSLGTHWEIVRSKSTNLAIPRLIQSTFHYISIVETIQSLFKQKKFSDMYFDFNLGAQRHQCVEGVYEDFCCGKVYKESSLFSRYPEALQIQLATDDIELNDPLGSKSGIHKMCPIYFTIKNVPKHFLSKLSNLYLVSLCRADDLKTKETDFNDLWEHIVREISYLEENGVQINGYTNIRGSISYNGFDNLGANTSLGFVESFNSYFCRFCIASKKQTQSMISEDLTLLRTIEGYESHLNIIADSEKVDFSETKGVKRSCALNKLKYFHILKNKSVDIMHDLNEGCIPFLLKHLFQYFISEKLFDDDWIQKKVQFFNFGSYSQNTPSLINIKKDNLNQNASQLICLFRNIGFILYEFRNNEKVKQVWTSVESLQKIVQICYSSKIRDSEVKLLKQNISIHLQNILEIFQVHLIPKHHLLLHYPSIICEMGPVCHMSMMRFESKHKSLKNTAKRGNNFINITKTISMRNQAELVFKGFTYCDEIDCGKISRVNVSKLTEIEQEPIISILNESYTLCEIEWFKVNSFTYRKHLAILHDNVFNEISRILVLNDQYFFLCNTLKYLQFDSFTHSLILEEIDPPIQHLIPLNELNFKKPYEIKSFDQKKFVFAETLDVCEAL